MAGGPVAARQRWLTGRHGRTAETPESAADAGSFGFELFEVVKEHGGIAGRFRGVVGGLKAAFDEPCAVRCGFAAHLAILAQSWWAKRTVAIAATVSFEEMGRAHTRQRAGLGAGEAGNATMLTHSEN